MTDIPWELNATGGCAVLINSERNEKKTPAKLKREAIQRMTDVSLVSADFGKKTRVFETALWAVFDSGSTLEFIALYFPAFSYDENDDLPSVCVRTCEWKRAGVGDKGRALSVHDSIYTRFFKSDTAKTFFSKFQFIEESFLRGLAMVPTDIVKDAPHESITVFLNANTVSVELDYSPKVRSDAYFDSALLSFKGTLDSIDTRDEMIPDKFSHYVSYRESVLDKLKE